VNQPRLPPARVMALRDSKLAWGVHRRRITLITMGMFAIGVVLHAVCFPHDSILVQLINSAWR
jgi:hypothetical protein